MEKLCPPFKKSNKQVIFRLAPTGSAQNDKGWVKFRCDRVLQNLVLLFDLSGSHDFLSTVTSQRLSQLPSLSIPATSVALSLGKCRAFTPPPTDPHGWIRAAAAQLTSPMAMLLYRLIVL